MTYYIAILNPMSEGWLLMSSDDKDYITRAYHDINLPPEWWAELRQTDEDLETHVYYQILEEKKGEE